MTRHLKLGEFIYFTHLDDCCEGMEGRCGLCGGLFGECQCGDCNYDACVCGGKIENILDTRPIHIWRLIWRGIIKEIYYGFRYGDWYGITHRWRGL